MARIWAPLLAILLYFPLVFAAFGVTKSGNSFVVDSGAGLVTTSESYQFAKRQRQWCANFG